MKGKSDKFVQLMRSCREQRWSLNRYKQELKQYYSDLGQYRRGERFSTALSWIRWHVRDERWRRIRERQQNRETAQRKVQQAVAKGVLKKPQHCEHCQRRTIKRKLQGHHRDYRYPLRVIWLCQSCHIRAQGKRAIKRAAFYARKRELAEWLEAKEEKLRRRYKAGQISRRRYQKLRRELYDKWYFSRTFVNPRPTL